MTDKEIENSFDYRFKVEELKLKYKHLENKYMQMSCKNAEEYTNLHKKKNKRITFLKQMVKKLNKQLQCKEQECEELKERIKCNCFDPKSNNNRCISYNRIAEDYERDLKRLENKIAECEKYEGAFRRIEKQSKINCEEICGKNYDACNDKDCLAIQIRDIINKVKDGNNE